MLKAIWDRVVHNYQEIRQSNDLDHIKSLERRRKEAEQGFETRYTIPVVSYHATPVVQYKVDLSPERAKEIIKECDDALAETKKRMELRREKYGLSL